MKLPTYIYESIPYAYILSGAAILFQVNPSSEKVATIQAVLLSAAGLFFYIAGAYVWVLRSTYRGKFSRQHPSQYYRPSFKRTDQVIDVKPDYFYLRSGVYESLPFTYILLSLVSCKVLLFSTQLSEFEMLAWGLAALLFGLAGLSTWFMRWHYRGYQTPRPELHWYY